MSMRSRLSRRRPRPAPASEFPSGLVLSLTAHTALVVAVTGGGAGGGARSPGRAEAPAGGETLQWVGLTSGPGARPLRPGERAPVAYVVAGRDRRRVVEVGESVARDAAARGAAPADPSANARAAGAADDARRNGPFATGGPSGSLAAPPRERTTPARGRVTIPDVRLPDEEVTRLVAGVIASSVDLAERVTRAEDFTVPGQAGVLTRIGQAVGARPDLHTPTMPVPFLTNPLPAYPGFLARAGVGGRVVVEFLIDSTGAVDPHTFRVVESSGTQFADAVRRVLPRLRFLPGQLGEQAVGVTVRQPYLFTMRGVRAGL